MPLWEARTVAWAADEASELGCATIPAADVRGVWLVCANDIQKEVLDELRREAGHAPLQWHASRRET